MPTDLPDTPSEPVRFAASMETIAPDESETIQGIVDTMRSINAKTLEDSGHANRSVHAKAHALLTGEMTVLDGLPDTLAQGVFAVPKTYPVVIRISTNPGDVLDDRVSVPRGLALKIVGVEGERLPGSESMTTQDFVMIDAPAFSAPDAKGFLKTLKLLAATTDRAEGLKRAASAVFRGTEKAVKALGGESGTLISLGGHPLTNPAGETYHTQVPLLHGPYVAKLSLAPASAGLKALTDAQVDLKGKPNGLRDALVAFFAENGGEWDLRVQLLTDPEVMPIEDASVPWPEAKSPHVPVARIKVAPQSAYDEGRRHVLDQAMAFSPWHGLQAHRPIGSIMRARKPAYEMSANFRSSANKCPIHEPKSVADLS